MRLPHQLTIPTVLTPLGSISIGHVAREMMIAEKQKNFLQMRAVADLFAFTAATGRARCPETDLRPSHHTIQTRTTAESFSGDCHISATFRVV